jgi:hypothetical protein
LSGIDGFIEVIVRGVCQCESDLDTVTQHDGGDLLLNVDSRGVGSGID